jgi:hypothetical protein
MQDMAHKQLAQKRLQSTRMRIANRTISKDGKQAQGTLRTKINSRATGTKAGTEATGVEQGCLCEGWGEATRSASGEYLDACSAYDASGLDQVEVVPTSKRERRPSLSAGP